MDTKELKALIEDVLSEMNVSDEADTGKDESAETVTDRDSTAETQTGGTYKQKRIEEGTH